MYYGNDAIGVCVGKLKCSLGVIQRCCEQGCSQPGLYMCLSCKEDPMNPFGKLLSA